MASIGRYYDELASSYPIPQSYLCKYSLAQLEESIALELWDASYSDQDQRKVDGKRGIQASQGSQDGEDSRGDKVGRGARRGRGGRESQSRRWRTPLCPEGRHFRDIIPTIISVDTLITPMKFQHQQLGIQLKSFFLDPKLAFCSTGLEHLTYPNSSARAWLARSNGGRTDYAQIKRSTLPI